MFTIKGDDLLYDGVHFGPKSALYVDRNELKKLPRDGVIRRTMPNRIDMVFVAGDSVIGVESKKPNDLNSSIHAGRLARQIRTLMKEVDVPCLLMRGIPQNPWGFESDNNTAFNEDLFHVWVDLVRLQCLGVYILPGPELDEDVPKWLGFYRPSLAGGRTPLASIARTDKKAVKPGNKGWFLKNIKGIGGTIATKLHRHFGSTRNALLAKPEEWRELGISQKVVDRKEEALK